MNISPRSTPVSGSDGQRCAWRVTRLSTCAYAGRRVVPRVDSSEMASNSLARWVSRTAAQGGSASARTIMRVDVMCPTITWATVMVTSGPTRRIEVMEDRNGSRPSQQGPLSQMLATRGAAFRHQGRGTFVMQTAISRKSQELMNRAQEVRPTSSKTLK